MKIVIFAGGAGTRLWPLSRKKTPKQFEKIIDNQSTLQLSVKRLLPEFDPQDIYISTNIAYEKIVKKQLPQIPEENFFFEPEKKNVGPAIALVAGCFYRFQDPEEPFVILWSDHLIKKEKFFCEIIKNGVNYINQEKNKILFIGIDPRFPSTNLGYIHYGQQIKKEPNFAIHQFRGFRYKPDPETAEQYFQSGEYAWNLGYFISTPKFIYQAFKRYTPDLYRKVEKILDHYGKKDYHQTLNQIYSQIEPISFDNAVPENIDPQDALVMVVEDFGWSDIGTWESIQEAFQDENGNYFYGNAYIKDVFNSLIYNKEKKKLVVCFGSKNLVVVNTKDVLMVIEKSALPRLKEILDNLAASNKSHLL